MQLFLICLDISDISRYDVLQFRIIFSDFLVWQESDHGVASDIEEYGSFLKILSVSWREPIPRAAK